MKPIKTLSFEAATEAAAEASLARLCNDGNCWSLTVIFGKVRAYAYPQPLNVPRLPAGHSAFGGDVARYWRSGRWYDRRPPTDRQEQKYQAEADRAAGVSDGGGEGSGKLTRQDLRRFFRRCYRNVPREHLIPAGKASGAC